MASFSIASYNCKNFNSVLRSVFISHLLDDCDVVCLQEHHLFDSEFYNFYDMCGTSTTMYSATSAMDVNVFHRGQKHGGTAILWKKNLKYAVSVLKTISKRLCAVNVNISDTIKLLIVCAYMPCDEGYRGPGHQEYQDILSEVSTICQQEDASHVCVVGDFNTEFTRSTPQTQELLEFCHAES